MRPQWVSQHCKYVEMKCSHVIRTVADRQECRPAYAPHFAGVQLSLDLSNAFDLLDWRLIDRALLDAGVDPELRNQVMSWYFQVTYHIEHLNRTAQVTAQKGLRQGCQLAPILWAMGMGVAADPTNQVTAAWLQTNTTTYADDIHLMEVAKSSVQLDRLLHNFGTMLDALADNDMIINAAKSAVLLRHRGTFIKKWLRRHKQQTPDGDFFYLRTPKGREFRFPIREQHTYLGVKISYHAMAKHTTLYRLQAANQAWQRLRSVLCSSGRLALPHRISLWKATVLPTLLYGLAAIDPEPKDCARLQSLVIKQVRAMAKSFAHLHYESSSKVLLRCGVLSAKDQLQKETEGLLRRLRIHADNTPLVSTSQLEALRTQAARLQVEDLPSATVLTQSTGEEPGHPCQVCGRTFRSFRLLRSHEAKWHQLNTPTPKSTEFDRYEHGQDGLPTCRHCGHRFRQWANLKQHIQRNRCQALRTNSAPDDSTSRQETGTQNELRAETPVPAAPNQAPQAAHQAELTTIQESQDIPSCPGEMLSSDQGDRATDLPRTEATSTIEGPRTASTKPIPLQDWPLVKQKLQAGSWTDLLESVEVREHLQHHCPICERTQVPHD